MDSFIEQVAHIFSEPFYKDKKRHVKIGLYSFGRYFRHTLSFNTEEEAKKVKIGYEFRF